MKNNYRYLKVFLSNEEIEILLGLIGEEIAKLAGIKSDLKTRGINDFVGINLRLIDLKHLLKQFTELQKEAGIE